MCVMPPRYHSLAGFIRFRLNLRMALIPFGTPFRKDSFRVPSSMTSETRSIINDPCQWLSTYNSDLCLKKSPLYRRTDGAAGLGGISVVGDPYKKSDPTRTCRRIVFFPP